MSLLRFNFIIHYATSYAMQSAGRYSEKKGKTLREKTVKRECKNPNKTTFDLKQLAQLRIRWRVDVLMPYVPVGMKEIKKKKNSKYVHQGKNSTNGS